MAISGAQEKTRVARAIWAYTLKKQDELASDAGMKFSRLRAILARTDPDEAHLEELLKLAKAAGLPEEFALHGFSAIRTNGAAQQPEARPVPPPPGELGRHLRDDPTKAADQQQRGNPKGPGKRKGGAG